MFVKMVGCCTHVYFDQVTEDVPMVATPHASSVSKPKKVIHIKANETTNQWKQQQHKMYCTACNYLNIVSYINCALLLSYEQIKYYSV